MPWVKVDEAFYDHPKFLDLDAGAVGIWLIGLAYSNRYLTSGAIPRRGLARAYPGTDREKHARSLVTAGLWDPTEDGWVIHDYLTYQPSKAQVEARRNERSESGRRGAARRWGKAAADREPPPDDSNSHGSSYGSSDGNSHSYPDGKPDGYEHGPSRTDTPTSRLTGSTGPVDNRETTTTENRHPEALAACRILAEQDLSVRRTERPDGAPPADDPARCVSWLVKGVERRWQRHGGQAQALAAEGLDAATIAARLTGQPPALTVVRPLPPTFQAPGIEPDPTLNTSGVRAVRDLLRAPKSGPA